LPVCRRHNAMPLVCGCPGVILYQYGTEVRLESRNERLADMQELAWSQGSQPRTQGVRVRAPRLPHEALLPSLPRSTKARVGGEPERHLPTLQDRKAL